MDFPNEDGQRLREYRVFSSGAQLTQPRANLLGDLIDSSSLSTVVTGLLRVLQV